MNKKSLIITIAVAVVFAGAGFLGGMQYQKTKRITFTGDSQMFNRGGTAGLNNRPRGTRTGMQPVSGEITAVDDKSVTVKTNDGSSKIVIFSATTSINKTSTGAASDLKTGEKVMIIGTSGTDGTVTAQSISIGGTFGVTQVGRPPQE
jgi:hypothetical protein